MKSQFICVVLFLKVLLVIGQNSLSGKIVDAKTSPIAFATISAYPVSDSTKISATISEKNGVFSISDLRATNYTVVIQMLGFQDYTAQVLVDGTTTMPTIKLVEEATVLDEVEVTAKKSVLENRLGKKILRIGQDLSNTGSTALEAMERIPSVTTTRQGGIQIRGSSNIIVYINGKETTRDASTLQYIPAEVLEKIEVITNPSAKYDAAGVAGIVNIVYKKNRQKAIKIDALVNVSLPERYTGGLSVNYNRKTFSFYMNATMGYEKSRDVDNTERVNTNVELIVYQNKQNSTIIGRRRNLDLGITYQPDSTLAIDFEINYNRWDDASQTLQTNSWQYRNEFDNQLLINNNQRKELEDEVTTTLSLTKDFSSAKKLKLLFSIGGEDERNSNKFDDLGVAQISQETQRFLKSSDETESQRLLQGKLDYESPFFGFGTFETGLKLDYISYDIFQNVVFQDDALGLPNNEFAVSQNKYAIYALQKKSFDRFEYGLGLRLEHFSSDGFQQSNEQRFTQKRTQLFPSIQMLYHIDEQVQNLGFTYSKRINRPGFFDINPYVSFSDPLNLKTGNPDLKPEIASLIELNYHLQIGNFTTDITGFYRQTKDVIQDVIKTIGSNQTLQTRANFDKRTNQGIEAQFEYDPKGVFNTYATFDLRYSTFSDANNLLAFNRTTSWRFRLNQQLKFENNWTINLSQNYRAPSFQPQSKVKSQFYMNFSLSKKFKNGKGSISLNARDIFKSRNFTRVIQGPDFTIKERYTWQSRSLTLGLRYTILE